MPGGRRRALRRALTLRQRGYELGKAGAHAEGHRALSKSIRIYRRLLDSGSDGVITGQVGRTPVQSDVGWELGVALWRLANVASALGRFDEAVVCGSEAAEHMSADVRRRSPEGLLGAGRRYGLAVCLTDLGVFAAADGSPEAAVEHATRAVDLLTDESGKPRTPVDEEQLGTAYHVLAGAHLAAGSLQEAAAGVGSALAIRERAHTNSPAASLAGYELANSLLLHSRILSAQGKRRAAVAAVDRATRLAGALGLAGVPLLAQAEELRKTLK